FPHSVYPACAGIDRGFIPTDEEPVRLPRMRGDRPETDKKSGVERLFTPHARGSTPAMSTAGRSSPVYPACARIDPQYTVVLAKYAGLPRMRGDRPTLHDGCITREKFTPHARGSTARSIQRYTSAGVYPACAGIDHASHHKPALSECLPRMRGDRP